jgi:hypothetical protein
LAAPFEWKLHTTANTSTITAMVQGTYLKKSELPSGGLLPSLKLSVPVGTSISLVSSPTKPVDTYWRVTCAAGVQCGMHTPAAVASTPAQRNIQLQPNTSISTNIGTATPATTATASKSVLVVGDSISIGYFPFMQRAFANATNSTFTAVHSPGNAGNINKIQHQLECWLGSNSFDVITFNAGIHDLAKGQEWLSLQVYTSLMRTVSNTVAAAAKHGGCYFVTTTPVPTNSTDPTGASACPEGIIETELRRYNAAASAAAAAAGCKIIDLHATVIAVCGDAYTSCAIQGANNPHFTDAGWALLGNAIAKAVIA